ncbi:Glyoxylate reductase [Geodia barretti]|uniref:Glyoxylate reductase n=1 Tax=Geodia barretti TaxID=519541 RepID=A0AA35RHX1_GEOBA|nr:Glyoxylate reductase [Geodia barretti]
MSTARAFVTRTLLPEALGHHPGGCDVTVWPEETPPSVEELRRHCGDADGISDHHHGPRGRRPAGRGPTLRAISQLAVGLDNVDVAEATRRGIPVGYTPGVLAKSTADLAMALLLGAARRTSESERWLRGGGWQIQFHPTHWLGQDVHEACLGIVGLGQIGREIAKRAGGFDMDIVYHSRTRYPDAEAEHGLRYAEFSRPAGAGRFRRSQCAADSATHHLISGPQLAMMKPSAILINVSRGRWSIRRRCTRRCATGRSRGPPWT